MKLDVDITKLKPSELIRLALEEARIVEASENDRLCMDLWVVDFGSYCKTCLAGAIMFRHTRAVSGEKRSLLPTVYDRHTMLRLMAINAFCQGRIEDALEQCDVKPSKLEEACPRLEAPMAEAWEAYRPGLDVEDDEDDEPDHDYVFEFMEEIARLLALEGL